MLVFPRDLVDFQNVTSMSVRDRSAEPGTCLVEMEGDAVFHALDMYIQDPAVITGTGFWAGFSPAGDGLQDAASVLVHTAPVFRQIFAYINGFQHRLMRNGFVPDRKLEKDRKSAVSPGLIFAGTADMDMIPSLTSVCREALKDPLRALGDYKE